MAIRYPSFLVRRAPAGVRNMSYAGQISGSGLFQAQFGAPVAAAGAALLSGQSINSAGSTTNLLRNDIPARWGRNLTAVASGASTATVTFVGLDYLNQRVVETITLNGTNTVQGQKSFAWVDSISWTATSGITINVGFGNRLGIPFKGIAMVSEIKNGAVSANPGTFVAGLANNIAATATNTDVRGYYTPAVVVPDGNNTFSIVYVVDDTNLHGNAQFAG